ncbi:hypothetical protein PC113_g15154 [Phytophthora cactorum]|uniref:Uncharacterized protein n=1 Tax=Phytophthora cactorum TaxID=29920 RepID=A0A8T0YTY7_9STRA|nr:hypothetical protein PC113_g15154 [Phytophthora cactorum]
MAPPKPAGKGSGSTPTASSSPGQPGSPTSTEDPRASVRSLSNRVHTLIIQLQDVVAARDVAQTEHDESRRNYGIQLASSQRTRSASFGGSSTIKPWRSKRDYLRQSNDHLFQETELESSIQDLSDKLKTARDAADTLNHQVSEIQGRHDQLAADHDRTFRQRDEGLRRLAAVAETASRPIRIPGVRSLPVSSAGVSGGGSGSAAAASGSLDQPSSGPATPASSSTDHGSGSSASTSPPAPASKSASPGPRTSGGGASQTPAKRPGSGATSSDAGSFRTRKPPRAPPADVGQGTKPVDLTMGEIDDDVGASGEIDDNEAVSGSENRRSTVKTSARSKVKQPIPHGFDFSSSDKDDEDDEGDDDLEDSEEAQIADDLLEEDTRRALSLSRSEARRRSHATPSRHYVGGSGGPARRVGRSS